MLSWEAAHELARSLPEAEERDHFGSPSFRVRGKILAQLSSLKNNEARALIKLLAADQAALIAILQTQSLRAIRATHRDFARLRAKGSGQGWPATFASTVVRTLGVGECRRNESHPRALDVRGIHTWMSGHP